MSCFSGLTFVVAEFMFEACGCDYIVYVNI